MVERNKFKNRLTGGVKNIYARMPKVQKTADSPEEPCCMSDPAGKFKGSAKISGQLAMIFLIMIFGMGAYQGIKHNAGIGLEV